MITNEGDKYLSMDITGSLGSSRVEFKHLGISQCCHLTVEFVVKHQGLFSSPPAFRQKFSEFFNSGKMSGGEL